jgi:replication-associated recombination protein RarA
MVSYKELGLVNSKELFKKAIEGGYAIPAFNFNNLEQLQAIVSACVETKSPVIMQVSSGARKYANQTLLRYMAQGAVEYAKELDYGKDYKYSHDYENNFVKQDYLPKELKNSRFWEPQSSPAEKKLSDWMKKLWGD